MSVPAVGRLALFRNPIWEVIRFFETMHKVRMDEGCWSEATAYLLFSVFKRTLFSTRASTFAIQ